MLDTTQKPSLEELQEQQRQLTEALKEVWREELEELTQRAEKLGYVLVPANQVQKKRGRKPKQQQDQF